MLHHCNVFNQKVKLLALRPLSQPFISHHLHSVEPCAIFFFSIENKNKAAVYFLSSKRKNGDVQIVNVHVGYSSVGYKTL